MKLEDQVCTLGQADKLKTLGLDLDTIFRFDKDGLIRRIAEIYHEFEKSWLEATIPAYTVAELGVLLSQHGDWNAGFDCEDYYCTIYIRMENGIAINNNITTSKNLTHCMADNLIWLIENDFVKTEDLKL